MKAIFQRVVFKDEWLQLPPRHPNGFVCVFRDVISRVRPPQPNQTREFTNYALGFRWEATPRELQLIQRDDLFGQPALRLRDTEPPFSFAEILGPEFIPEVNPAQAELLRIEGRVREAAMLWTHAFENMKQRD